MNSLNTFIELLTITKHNVWPLENKKQQMDQFWSWQILLQICDKGEIIQFLYSLRWYIYVYIQCVSLQFSSMSVFFLKLLSKQKNHNLEISVLGQLCPSSPVTGTLKGSRTLSEITWCKEPSPLDAVGAVFSSSLSFGRILYVQRLKSLIG